MNLRARPVADAEVVGQVSAGAKLASAGSLTEGSEWIKVRPPREVDLWVFSQLLTAGSVNADNTLVRGGPGLQFKSVGKLAKGTAVEVRGEKGDWTRIAPVEGRCELWIHSDYVEKIPLPPPASAKRPVAVTPPPRPAVVPAVAHPVSPVAPPAPPAPAGKKASPPLPVATAPVPSHPVEPAKAPAVSPSSSAKAPPPVAAPAPSPALPAASVAPAAPAPSPAIPVVSVDPASLAPKVAPVVDAPAPVPVPALPAALAGVVLDDHYRQGGASVLKGRLKKAPPFSGLPSARFQLVENATVVCRLTGCVGQWAELVDSDVQVRGSLWMVAGDPVPVLHVTRADRLASWDK